jgi:hypothetical protein
MLKHYLITYYEPTVMQEVYALLGKPYGFFASVSMGGTGSPLLFYQSGFEPFDELLELNQDVKRSNVQLFPKGFMINFHVNLEVYGLPIPYEILEKLYVDRKDDGRVEVELLLSTGNRIRMAAGRNNEMQVVKFFCKPCFNDFHA